MRPIQEQGRQLRNWWVEEMLGTDQPLVDLITEHSHTCYQGDRTHRHAWGFGCGAWPACELRRDGFHKYQALKSTDTMSA